MIFSVLLISACSEGEVERDVAWYLENRQELESKVEECSNDAKLEATSNCKNAKKAKAELLYLKLMGK